MEKISIYKARICTYPENTKSTYFNVNYTTFLLPHGKTSALPCVSSVEDLLGLTLTKYTNEI
jgi:hypothetical protein